MASATTTGTAISIRAYARRRGVSDRAVRDAITTGRLQESLVRKAPNEAPKVRPEEADAEWERRTSPAFAKRSGAKASAAAPEPAAGPDDYRQTLTLEKVVKTQIAQLNLEERRGSLVRAEDVKRAHFEIARRMRGRFLELPDRLADELATEGSPARIREILMREIREALTSEALGLASGE